MPQFAIYYIPPRGDLFYQAGTGFVGYDIRNRQVDESRTNPAKVFGFHATIGDTMYFEHEQLPIIEAELEACILCFKKESRFSLTQEEFFIDYLGKNNAALVLRYRANPLLLMLHTLIISRVNPLSNGSFYTNADMTLDKNDQMKLMKFYSPFVLDTLLPHFTILNPAPYKDELLEREVRDTFIKFTHIEVSSLCLVVKEDDSDYWVIHREFFV